MIEIRLAEAAARVDRDALAHDIFSRALPDAAAAAAGARSRIRAGAAGAADRRARPHRRAVRGVPARGARRTSRSRSPSSAPCTRRRAADRRHHVEPHARDPRRDQAALPLSLDRLSRPPSASSRSSRARVPERAGAAGARRSSRSCSGCARRDLFKLPGVAETLDWARRARRARLRSSSTRDRRRQRSACCSSTRTTSRGSRVPRRRRSPDDRSRLTSSHFVRLLRRAGLRRRARRHARRAARGGGGRCAAQGAVLRRAARGARAPPRRSRAVRRGVPAVLARSDGRRERARAAASAGATPTPRTISRRLSEAWRAAAGRAARGTARSRPSIDTFLAYSPDEVLAHAATSIRCRPTSSRALARLVKRLDCDAAPATDPPRRDPRTAAATSIRARRVRDALRRDGELGRLRWQQRSRDRPRSSRCATSRARWAATPRCCCGSSHAARTTAAASTSSCSRPASRTSRARCATATSTARSREVGREVSDWASGDPARRRACASSTCAWSRRVLAQGAIVLLVTDGLDRDDATLLATEAARLRRSCRRLVWLNPLLRYRGLRTEGRRRAGTAPERR